MRTWSTDNLKPGDQFEYWREVICEAFTALSSDADAVAHFASYVAQKDFGGVLISDSRSRAQTIERGLQEIRRSPTAGFFVNFQLAGTCHSRQDDRQVLAGPGDFYLLDTTRPYVQCYSDWHALCVYLPHSLMEERLIDSRRATAVRMSFHDGGLGSMAGTFIQSLMSCSESIDAAAREAVIVSLADVLALALGATGLAKEQSSTAVESGLRRAVAKHLRLNAADPAISPGRVAERFQISSEALHRLLDAGGESFGRMLMDERLRLASVLLGEEEPEMPIGLIAVRCGFADPPQLARAFKRRHGMTPSAYRQQILRRRRQH